FPGKKRRKREVLSGLKKLQDALGDVNDVAVQAGLKGEMVGAKGRKRAAQNSQQRAFAAGLIIGHQKARLESLLQSAGDAYKDFKNAKPFWTGLEPAPPQLPAPAAPVTPASQAT